MSREVPFEYSFREAGNVLVQDMSAWDGDPEGLDTVSREWLELANQDHIDGTVTVFGEDLMLGPETQDELAREWDTDAKRADIERIGYVSDGIKARAVSANLDIDYQVRTFDDLDAAIEWAGGQ